MPLASRNFWATVYKTVSPRLSDRCPVCLTPVCNVGVLWPNGWMDQDKTCHGGRPQPRPHCVRWPPSSPVPQKRGEEPPNFQPMSAVAIRSNISATAEHLLWSPYVIGQTIIFLPCDCYLSSFFFPRLISPAVDWMSTVLPHMVWS